MKNTQLPNPSLIVNPGEKSLSELLPKNKKVKKCNKNHIVHLNKQNLNTDNIIALAKIDEKINLPKLNKKIEMEEEIDINNLVQEEKNQEEEEIIRSIDDNNNYNSNNNKDNENENIGQILNNNKKVIGIIDGNKKIQMLDNPINKLHGIPVVGYNLKKVLAKKQIN